MNLIFYVGTHRLAAMLAEAIPDGIRILRFAEIQNAEGFQKGSVSELEKALASVGELLRRLELGEEAFEIPAYVLVTGPHLKMTCFSSSVYYSGYPRTVTAREVRQVVEQTRNIAPLPLEDWILQVVPESFWVNDLTGVQDPVGLEAQRLAVSLQIYSANYSYFRNLARVFEMLEFNLKGYFPKTLLLAGGVLNGNEREGEALLIDFSDESTHLVLTREGKIVQARSLEIGSQFLTSRVAQTWNLSTRDARRLKERFGSLESNVQYGEELIPLVEREGQEKRQIKRSEFHQAFLSFGNELFVRLEQEVKVFLEQAKGGTPRFILTGGGAKLEGIVEFLSGLLSRPVRLGTPRQVEAPSAILMDPAWAAPVGLVRWLADHGKIEGTGLSKQNLLERVFFHAKEFLAAYF